MQISSNFDSGNIEVIDASNPQQVLLAIRPDLNSGHFQWFTSRLMACSLGSVMALA